MTADTQLMNKELGYLDEVKFNRPLTLSFQPPPIEIIFEPGMSFEDIDRECQKKMKEAACNGMSSILSQVDDIVRRERKRGAFHNEHSDEKKLFTWCGEVWYRRRVYTDREGNTRYLCDEVLGLSRGQGVSPDILLRALMLAGEGSYQKVAQLIEKWTGVRRAHETYRRWVLRIGHAIEEQERAQRFLMFEDPSLIQEEDKKGPDILFLEVDGCHIYIIDEDEKKLWEKLSDHLENNCEKTKREKSVSKKEVRLGLWYEGKQPRRGTVGNGEWEVTGKTYFGGFMEADEFWELAAVVGNKRYGLAPETLVVGNGDGAIWIGPRFEEFARSLFVLCRYHWKRDIFRIFPEEEARKLINEVEADEKGKVTEFLDNAYQACSEKDSKKRKNTADLKKYLLNNWDGIQNFAKLKAYLTGKDPALARVGVIEGHIYQVLYLRFESRGGCWSIRGLNSLFRILTARLNGTLELLLKNIGWEGALRIWTPPDKAVGNESKRREHSGCRKCSFPILRGSMGKPFAHMLKAISQPMLARI